MSNEIENWDYYIGNTWQFWIGPRLSLNDPNYQKMIEVQRVFQQCNVIKECVDSYAVALLSRYPNWFLKKESNDKISQANLAEQYLQSWLDQIDQSLPSSSWSDPLLDCLTQALVTGQGYLRLYERDRPYLDPVDRIKLHSLPVQSVKVIRDEDGFVSAYEYSYDQGKIERQELLPDGKLHYTLWENNKMIREFISDLGGHFSIFELRIPPLVDDAIKTLQNGLNLTLTMMIRNTELSGFLASIFLNAQPPGTWEMNEYGERVFIPDKKGLYLAPDQLAFVAGLPIGNPESPQYTTPSVHTRHPVDIKTYIDSINLTTQLIYRQFSLGHLLSTTEQISGVSRELAKQAWESRLYQYVRPIGRLFNQVLSVVLFRLADLINPSFREYDVCSQIRLTVGQLPENRKQNREDFLLGLRSKTTAMSETGIEDTDAELQLINREKLDNE